MALLVAALLLAVAAPALAAPPRRDQGEANLRPRTIAVWAPIRHYIVPSAAPASSLAAVSLVQVSRALRAQVEADPRHKLISEEPLTRLLSAQRDEAQSDLRFVATRSAQLGVEYFKQSDLRSAVDQLEEAQSLLERTGLFWTDPTLAVTVWRTLALAELELAQGAQEGSEGQTLHEAKATAAFKELIRWAPSERFSREDYPAEVVATFERAYLEHLLSLGSDLRVRAAEAKRLATQLGVEELVFAFAISSGGETVVGLQFFDAASQQFVVDETKRVAPAVAADTYSMLLSDALACQPPRFLPPDPAGVDTGHTYASAGYNGGSFLDSPTRAPFYTQGASVQVSHMLSENAGLYAGGRFVFGRRDTDGDLLERVDIARTDFGATFAIRNRRFRAYGSMGIDVAFVGAVTATEDFWCKVTGGEVQAIDSSRACNGNAITRTAAQAQAGVGWTVGGQVLLGGPFWASLDANTAIYMLPFGERPFDIPMGGSLQLGYRF
jgi:hypothetical protein